MELPLTGNTCGLRFVTLPFHKKTRTVLPFKILKLGFNKGLLEYRIYTFKVKEYKCQGVDTRPFKWPNTLAGVHYKNIGAVQFIPSDNDRRPLWEKRVTLKGIYNVHDTAHKVKGLL